MKMDKELRRLVFGKSPEEAIRLLDGRPYQLIPCGDPQFVMYSLEEALENNDLPKAKGNRGDVHLIVASRGGTYSPRRDEVIDAYIF